jgi:hypothetical protein
MDRNDQNTNDDYGDLGGGLNGVDFFGLDRAGSPDGNPMWGAMIGTGLGTVTAVGVARYVKNPNVAKHAELIGLGAAVFSGGVMWLMGMRSSGVTAAVSGLLNNGLRALEKVLFKDAAMMGHLRGVVIEPTQALAGHYGGGMGMMDIEPTQALAGPVADYSQMPQLVGANLHSAADHIQLVGGPQLAQHSGAWGATVIGGGH